MSVQLFSSQVNTKYLSPLILAYDDHLKEKNDVIVQYEVSICLWPERMFLQFAVVHVIVFSAKVD